MKEPSENLVGDIRLHDIQGDLRQGDGDELEGKFRAANSSSALAVNTFKHRAGCCGGGTRTRGAEHRDAPPWAEVTGDRRFGNSHLARYPFMTWRDVRLTQ